jgi:hypothetical protein
MWAGPAFHIVLTAIELDLFATLVDQPLTVTELRDRLQTDARGTEILLKALVALKYLRQRGDRYANTPLTHKWLTDAGSINLSAYYQFWGAMMTHFMPQLTESIRRGEPPVNLYEWLETQPDVSRHFQAGLIALTRYVQADVVKALTLPATVQRLIDLGGGHATYSIALCQKYPQLTATVFDGAQALTVGRESIAAAGLTDRVSTRTGDFLNDALGAGYDVALLFNIMHGFSPAENLALFRKVRSALNPGGQVIVLEQLPGVAPLPLLNTTVQILSVSFFTLLGGQVYTYEDILGWLREAGFAEIRRKNVLQAGSALISGTI